MPNGAAKHWILDVSTCFLSNTKSSLLGYRLSPRIFREGELIFWFHSHDALNENRASIHIGKGSQNDGVDAKMWLESRIEVARPGRVLTRRELRHALELDLFLYKMGESMKACRGWAKHTSLDPKFCGPSPACLAGLSRNNSNISVIKSGAVRGVPNSPSTDLISLGVTHLCRSSTFAKSRTSLVARLQLRNF